MFFNDWQKKNIDLLEKTKVYIQSNKHKKPALYTNWESYFPFSPHSEKGQKLILIYACLNQNINDVILIKWIKEWYEKLDDNLFTATKLTYEDLNQTLQVTTGFSTWSLAHYATGILRSVDDFHKKYEPLSQWLKASDNLEENIQKISEEIFYMGKTSETKSKARWFIWLYHQFFPFSKESINNIQLPLSKGILRWHFFFQKRNIDINAKSQAHFHNLFSSLNPDQWAYYYPLNLFRDKIYSPTLYACQHTKNLCQLCSLKSFCFPND